LATYAIGDIQGCYAELIKLLDIINFNNAKDSLWFTGDLVNRGPKSLEVLHFIKSLDESKYKVVLGNHDLHLLAVANNFQKIRPDDTFQDVLNAPDCDELIDWLRSQKLLHYDAALDFILVHAGIYPEWDLPLAQKCAQEVEAVLRSISYEKFLAHLYGNHPNKWSDELNGFDRYRFIFNAFTRMRYCFNDGRLEYNAKEPIGNEPKNLTPWFKLNCHKKIKPNIVFGHWASLSGITNTPRVFAVDTGCSWGYKLTALRLDDLKTFSVNKIKE
jgi:bis(5'-nucleosyl)-tetraphosphatase (symmetrical)